MRTKIYTKTGDLGETSLIGGLRVSKADSRLEAYGTIDELNSCLGICISQISTSSAADLSVAQILVRIQNDLFIMGSQLACEDDTLRNSLPKIQTDLITLLEKEMDQMTLELHELKNFILPGGDLRSSFLHLARSICRRAERLVCLLNDNPSQKEIIIQLNRLSDYLFVAARYVNFKLASPEIIWQKPN